MINNFDFLGEIDDFDRKNANFSYDFSMQESKDLVLLLRKYEKEIPNTLKEFSTSLLKHIYDSMTIEEAEQFFHESI